MFGRKEPRTVLPVDEILATIQAADLKPEKQGSTIRFRPFQLRELLKAEQAMVTEIADAGCKTITE